MGFSFFVNGESPTEKVYCSSAFPLLTDDDFIHDPAYSFDDNGYFFFQDTWPSISVSHRTGCILLRSLDLPVTTYGDVRGGALCSLRQRILALTNSSAEIRQLVVSDTQVGRFIEFGISSNSLIHYLNRLFDIAAVAQKEQSYLRWEG